MVKRKKQTNTIKDLYHGAILDGLPCTLKADWHYCLEEKCIRTRNKRDKKYQNTFNRLSGLFSAVLRTSPCPTIYVHCATQLCIVQGGGGRLADQRSILTLVVSILYKQITDCTQVPPQKIPSRALYNSSFVMKH